MQVHDREVVRASDLERLDSSLCSADILAMEEDIAFALDFACRRITAIDFIDELLASACEHSREFWRPRLCWDAIFIAPYILSPHRPSDLVAAAISRQISSSSSSSSSYLLPPPLAWLPPTFRHRVESPNPRVASLQRDLDRTDKWLQTRGTPPTRSSRATGNLNPPQENSTPSLDFPVTVPALEPAARDSDLKPLVGV